MGRKRAVEPEGQVDEGKLGLGDLLVEQVREQLDTASIAAKLAPELAGRLVGTIRLDALSDRLLEKLAYTLANDTTIVEAVLAQLLARLQAKQLLGPRWFWPRPPPSGRGHPSTRTTSTKHTTDTTQRALRPCS